MMSMHMFFLVFWITILLIPLLAASALFAWRRKGNSSGAPVLAVMFSVLTLISVLANPFVNFLVFHPFFSGGVHRMLTNLKAETFVGRTKRELVARFGRPDRTTPRNDCDEELHFDCHPWFSYSYPEAVVVRITHETVVGFAYYH